MFTPKTNDELQSLLAPIQKQLGLRVWVQQLTVMSLLGMGGSLVLLLLARILPIPFYQWIALVLPVLFAIAGLIRALWLRPTWLQCAQVADGNGLAQRAVTAWENQENQSRIAGMQREDALRHLRKNLPQIVESVRIWPLVQKKVYAMSSLLVACVVLVAWPNPQDLRLTQMAEEKKAIAQVEKDVEAIKQEVKTNAALTDAQKKQLEEMLEQAKKALAKADDPAERQNALRAAEKQLEKLRDAQQQKQMALQALQRSLGNQEGTRALADALGNKDREAMTEALKQMAKAMQSMPQKEREEIARELASAAEQMKKEAEGTDDSQELKDIANQVAQAAEQAAQNQVPEAMTALENSLMQALTGMQQSEQAMLAATHAAASLSQSQMTLTTAGAQAGNAGTGSSGTGMAGAGQANPASGTPGNNPTAAQPGASPGNQSGNGNGNNGGGQGNGNGNGSGNGAGNGAGKGGAGGGTGGGAGLGKGKHELVTIPSERVGKDNGPTDTVGGPLGSGPSQTQQSGNTQVSSGGTLPYEEVYGQYEQFARESMEKGSIPSDYQQIVKDYFSNIEP